MGDRGVGSSSFSTEDTREFPVGEGVSVSEIEGRAARGVGIVIAERTFC